MLGAVTVWRAAFILTWQRLARILQPRYPEEGYALFSARDRFSPGSFTECRLLADVNAASDFIIHIGYDHPVNPEWEAVS